MRHPTVSRRRLLAGVSSLPLGALSGCVLEEPKVELMAEATFELVETDLVHSGPTYGSYSGFETELVESRSAFRALVDEEAWPNDVDRSQFEAADFTEDSAEGAEIVLISEAALPADGRIQYEDSLVNGGRLLVPVSMTCSDEPATRLEYRVQRWRHVGGGPLEDAGGNRSCLSETDSPGSGADPME